MTRGNTTKRFLVGILVLFALTASVGGGATGLDQGLGPVANPTERHEFYGFSILPPSGDNWFIDTRHARRGIPVSFNKRFGAGTSAGAEAHSVVALVTADQVDLPYYSREAVLEHFRQDMKREWWGEARYKPVSFEGSEDRSLDAVCLRYSVTVEDRGVPGFVGTMFTLSGRGFRCLHPYDPRLVINVGYSQRFRLGKWIKAFDLEVAPFLKSLEFTPVQLNPYIAKKLEDYAALLRNRNRNAEAAVMKGRVAKLRQAARSKEGSTDLGFNPSQALKEYAALLRSLNREAEAKEMEALADRRNRNNYAHFQKLMQR